ncbi:hypothetical protein C5L33_001796 [Lactobacillus pasteurii]|nr:hypothetical protein C5L33_001796 [Lactobacillus pasteurii]
MVKDYMQDNNWLLLLGNKSVKVKCSDVSEVARLLGYGICDIKVDVSNYKQDFVNNLDLFEKVVCERLQIKSNLKPSFEVIDKGIAPSYSRKTNKIIMPIKFLYLSKISNETRIVYDFFVFHELSHMLIDQVQGYKKEKIVNLLSYAAELYDDVFLLVDQKRLKLNVKRIVHEIMPDLIALIVAKEKYPNLFTNENWIKFEEMFYYPRSNVEMIQIFTQDPHAPIEIRLNVSRIVLQDMEIK